jgi:hypothetical protein
LAGLHDISSLSGWRKRSAEAIETKDAHTHTAFLTGAPKYLCAQRLTGLLEKWRINVSASRKHRSNGRLVIRGMGRSIEHGADRSVSVIHSRHPGGSSLQKAQARRPDRRWNSLALGQRMVD